MKNAKLLSQNNNPSLSEMIRYSFEHLHQYASTFDLKSVTVQRQGNGISFKERKMPSEISQFSSHDFSLIHFSEPMKNQKIREKGNFSKENEESKEWYDGVALALVIQEPSILEISKRGFKKFPESLDIKREYYITLHNRKIVIMLD